MLNLFDCFLMQAEQERIQANLKKKEEEIKEVLMKERKESEKKDKDKEKDSKRYDQ